MVKVKDDPLMAQSTPRTSSITTPSINNATCHPRKSRNPHTHPHHHHHHQPYHQHFIHYSSFVSEGGDAQGVGSANGASPSPARFYFGPGFEPQQVPEGGYVPGPSQGRGNEHVVLFHVNPGVTISFQMGDNLEILRGEKFLDIPFHKKPGFLFLCLVQIVDLSKLMC